MKEPAPQSKSLRFRILSGSAILLSGSVVASVLNFAYNFVVARFLGPADFGHATAVYTIIFLISSVTLSFQIVGAKVVAQQGTPQDKSAAYRDYHRFAWLCGLGAALLMLIFQVQIAAYLNLPEPLLVTLMAIGVAFYVPLGSRRGYIQGACRFPILAGNLVLEGVVRLAGSVLLILLGFGVPGVIVANSAGVVIAYAAIPPRLVPAGRNPLKFGRAFHELFTALIFFSGLAIINNSGIVMVKHYFPAVEAGIYAAVAMVGRVIFAFSSAVVNSTFPIAAGAGAEERKDPRVIGTSLLLILGIGSLTALFLWLAPSSLWRFILGSGFEMGGNNALSFLMPLYAIATTVYSLSAVLIMYEMSYKIANTIWLQFGVSVLLVVAISLFHSSLAQVIWVQMALMASLLLIVGAITVLTWHYRDTPDRMALSPIRLLRRVSEDEVIAEFLRSESLKESFRDYRERLGSILSKPNFGDEEENASRRAHLLLRHWRYWTLWRQLPVDTEWYEVEVQEADLDKIRVFPRAQWRNLARGNFSVKQVAEHIRTGGESRTPSILHKILRIRKRLLGRSGDPVGAVLLIGLNTTAPLTILDGNHRLLAAMVEAPPLLGALRFYCGLSPSMARCCWYRTNLYTLARYGCSLLARWVRGPDPALARYLAPPAADGCEGRLCTVDSPAAIALETTHGYETEPHEESKMTYQMRKVLVMPVPTALSGKHNHNLFVDQLRGSMQSNRPRVVLDCSRVDHFDKPVVHLLLRCLEEAMKRNGDIRLAGLPPGAPAWMDLTGASHLFETFDTTSEAVASFRELPSLSVRQLQAAGRAALESREAAS